MNKMKNSDWFVIPAPNAQAKMRLFCFPYAGGNAATFQAWTQVLPTFVELVIVQPPGRASRLLEPAINNMHEMTTELLKFSKDITSLPYVLLGHSLGSRVAYQLAVELIEQHYPSPIHFIASGSRAPHTVKTSERICDLPDKLFLDKIAAMNGTPKEVMMNKELMELLLPMLKADFSISDNYQASQSPLPCDITALAGTDDEQVSEKQLVAWAELTSTEFKSMHFHGGHFFIDTCASQVTDAISSLLHLLVSEKSVTQQATY
ncbi:hypothetical protein A1OO_09025 [Enterovibrio norvegicus FF-33]|uniref:thioesterase II family protein n=1 Tax=Enterovibrio norvegicus TaxID=188144 RepID=UPI0002F10DBB|nr:thioesterase domain-containing protein [Enterovibrio norvegicus]OEE65941.1 hypothetical protein A1OO_09025 [Enterovibrio norvegicus FF-33]